MKKILIALMLLGHLGFAAEKLSSNTVVELVTVSPGDQLYNAFGHSAIVILDKENGLFKLYNYGVFDFNDPDFYTNFTRGKLKYMLAVENPNDIIAMASYEGRSVYSQVLDLDSFQTQRLYDYLETNYLPQNRYYKYDFFYDNCSSRLRDALNAACGADLAWKLPDTNALSFRELIDPYLENQRYQDMGMDLGMGTPADVVATPAQMMFLPDYLKQFVGASFLNRNGKLIPLVKKESTLLENPPFPKVPFWQKPGILTGGIFLITFLVTLFQYRRARAGHWFDVTLFGVAALVSLLIIFLWFFTDHSVTKWNLHLVWANPILFYFIFQILRKKNTGWLRELYVAYFFATSLLLIFWLLWPQNLNGYLAPVVAALSLRALYIYYRLIKKTDDA